MTKFAKPIKTTRDADGTHRATYLDYEIEARHEGSYGWFAEVPSMEIGQYGETLAEALFRLLPRMRFRLQHSHG